MLAGKWRLIHYVSAYTLSKFLLNICVSTLKSSSEGQIVGARERLNAWEKVARRAPGDNVLPDQFQTVAAVQASDWCQKTFVFFRPISSQHTYGSFRVFLRGMIHEWQLLAVFVWAVRRGFARDEKFQSEHKI